MFEVLTEDNQCARSPVTALCPKPVVGVFSVGLSAYWQQFPGLLDRLESFRKTVEHRLSSMGCQVESGGMVDSSEKAVAVGESLRSRGIDLLVCHVATYATSSQLLPLVQRVKAPVLFLNLQPVAALDYETADTGEWLANCSACCLPEFSCALARAGIKFRSVSGMLHEDETAWGQIGGWCRAIAVAKSVSNSRIGFLGHTYPGMLDMYSDFTQVQGKLGAHIEILEMCDLDRRVQQVTEKEIQAEMSRAAETFEVAESVSPEDLRWAAQVSVGLDRLVKDFGLTGLSYYYRGIDGNPYERLGAALILGNSFLTAQGVPCSGEGDLKNCIAMMIMHRLNAGGSYTEFYAMDFKEDFVLMGHDGPGHIAISDQKPILRGLGLYHGKRGWGVSVEFKVRIGPVTILGLTQTADGGLKLLAAEGTSIPGPILRIGNTNSRLRFSVPPAEFVDRWCQEGPTHHCALGIGRQLGVLAQVSDLLNVPLKLPVGG